MNSIFSSYDAWLVGMALAALMLAAWRLGWRIGQRERQGGAERGPSKIVMRASPYWHYFWLLRSRPRSPNMINGG